VDQGNRTIDLAASILSANFACLGAEAQAAVEGGATVLHLDIMDGHFVPNLTIGPPVVAALRKVSPVSLDCHLMIEHPDEFIPVLAEVGVDWISVHQEACTHLDRTLRLIASHGSKPGVVINPGTPIHVLDEVLPLVHHVLVMSVNPGFGGQSFIHSSLRKIESLSKEIGGAINQELVWCPWESPSVPDFESAANGSGNGVVWPSEKLKGRGIRHHATAFAAPFKIVGHFCVD
jgi:ribulose-phosphate 3-epimerase